MKADGIGLRLLSYPTSYSYWLIGQCRSRTLSAYSANHVVIVLSVNAASVVSAKAAIVEEQSKLNRKVQKMNKRDKALIRYATIMAIHDDARHARPLHGQFTPEERQEIKELVNDYAEVTVRPEQVKAWHSLRGVVPTVLERK